MPLQWTPLQALRKAVDAREEAEAMNVEPGQRNEHLILHAAHDGNIPHAGVVRRATGRRCPPCESIRRVRIYSIRNATPRRDSCDNYVDTHRGRVIRVFTTVDDCIREA